MLAPVRDYNKVLEQVQKDNFMVINNHDNKEIQLAGIGLYHDGTPLAMCNARYYSTNELYIDPDDGRVHLSCCSRGPVVSGRDVQKANNSLMFKACGIKSVVWADGDIVEYTLSPGWDEGDEEAV